MCQLINGCYVTANDCDASQVLTILNGAALTSYNQFYYGDEVSFICNIGYLVTGTSLTNDTVVCQADGTWSFRPICVGNYLFSTLLFSLFFD